MLGDQRYRYSPPFLLRVTLPHTRMRRLHQHTCMYRPQCSRLRRNLHQYEGQWAEMCVEKSITRKLIVKAFGYKSMNPCVHMTRIPAQSHWPQTRPHPLTPLSPARSPPKPSSRTSESARADAQRARKTSRIAALQSPFPSDWQLVATS